MSATFTSHFVVVLMPFEFRICLLWAELFVTAVAITKLFVGSIYCRRLLSDTRMPRKQQVLCSDDKISIFMYYIYAMNFQYPIYLTSYKTFQYHIWSKTHSTLLVSLILAATAETAYLSEIRPDSENCAEWNIEFIMYECLMDLRANTTEKLEWREYFLENNRRARKFLHCWILFFAFALSLFEKGYNFQRLFYGREKKAMAQNGDFFGVTTNFIRITYC